MARLATRCGISSAIAVGLASPRASGQIPCGYDVAHIIQAPPCPVTGPPPTTPAGLSPNGRYVCGYYYSCGFTSFKGFVFDTESSQFTTLPMPTGISSLGANDVNDAGFVVGEMGGNVGDFGFIYDLAAGEYIQQIPPIDPLGTCSMSAINGSGVACGTRTVTASPNLTTAFVWSAKNGITDLGLINGKSTTANDINDNGTTTGTMFVSNVRHAMTWSISAGQVTDLGTLAGLESDSFAINDLEHVAGSSLVPQGGVPPTTNHATFGVASLLLTDLGTLPGNNLSIAADVNHDDVVVGLSRTLGQNNDHAFIWLGGSMVDLNDRINHQVVAILTGAGAVNDKGVVASSARSREAEIVTAVLIPNDGLGGDVNHDCRVNVGDLLTVINEWGKPKSAADANGDGTVNALDLMIVINNWTAA